MFSHFEYDIDILNDVGQVLGTKKRKDIDRKKDILPLVGVLVFTNGKLILGEINKTGDPTILPEDNGKLGYTGCTFLRHGEKTIDAAARALLRDVNLTNVPVTFLGQSLETYPNGIRRLAHMYVCTVTTQLEPNSEEISILHYFTRTEVEKSLQEEPDRFKNTFVACWGKYKDFLPF